MTPTKIKVKEKKFLVITWDDETVSEIKLANLRSQCPCAVCGAEKDERSSSYIPLYTNDELTIAKIEVVGNYAISVVWLDGHNTGIYEFKELLNISTPGVEK